MPSQNTQITLWNESSDQVILAPAVIQPSEIVPYASARLSKRDMESIVKGFENQSYEMVSTFIWMKASVALKKQVATLGMEFVGEMLGRPELTEDSDPTTSLGDYEVISLAEDLGMVTSTEALRLKHSLELVNHFANNDDLSTQESMDQTEAIGLLKTCVTSILGKPRFDSAVQFAKFRDSLGKENIASQPESIAAISQSYFFVKTTLSVLLSAIKISKGAAQEHIVGNSNVLIPALWSRLRDTEKWQVGQAYVEVNASGNQLASAGLKRALLSVHGFDFVPETVRSSTYTEAAARVLNAHFSFNNFYNETEPMSNLSSLGTTFPKPAFPKCMEATLAVAIGNRYGCSHEAGPVAEQTLATLRDAQWEYYLNECFPRDKIVLDKLCYVGKPLSRWVEIVKKSQLATNFTIRHRIVQELLKYCTQTAKDVQITKKAETLRQHIFN